MGSIITTPNTRKGYTKGGSPRMKISEKNTYKNSENLILALGLNKTILRNDKVSRAMHGRSQEAEKSTTKWVSGNVHGDTYETQHPSVKLRSTGEEVVPRHKEVSRHPFVMRTQGGRDIPKDKWEREKYWGTYNEVTRKYYKE